MKGIRETAMSKDTPPKKPEYTQRDFSDLDKYGYPNKGYLGDVSDYESSYTYNPPNKKAITITLYIDYSLIGSIADYTSEYYNWDKALTRATEIAYDRIEELLGKNYESKYTVSFKVIENLDEYEATVTLIPNNL